MADRLAIVRSYTPGDANHDIKPIVSRDTNKANLGSLYARIAGATDPATGMPRTRASVSARRRRDRRPGPDRVRPLRGHRLARRRLCPLRARRGGDLQQDMQLNLPAIAWMTAGRCWVSLIVAALRPRPRVNYRG